MSSFPRFVVWLILAALPLQGLAAASMRPCTEVAIEQSAAAVLLYRSDVGGPGHPGRHDGHAKLAPHPVAEAPAGATAESDSPVTAPTLSDGLHSCAVCALCGHAMAAPATRSLALTAPGPDPRPRWSAAQPASTSPTLPDKPPRA